MFYLEIPKLGGKILLKDSISYIGKKELQKCATTYVDPAIFRSISSIRKDPSSNTVIKQQFIISRHNGQYYIEDPNSTNGTYLGSYNLKQNPPQILHEGSEIIVPIEEQGVLVQLKMYLRKDHNVIPSSSQHPKKLKKSKNNYKKSHLFNDPTQTPTTQDQFHDPAQTPTTSSNSQESGRGEYYDPTFNPTVAPPSIPSVQDQRQIMSLQSGYDYSDSSKSFIIVKQKIPIPPNAFDPKVAGSIGLDLSLFWNLKIKEIWHIIIAYLLLVLMIYRTNMNIMLITAISSYGIDGVMTYSGQIFIDTIPGAVIFGIVFIVHELSHLETGKMHGYQSRFCLLNKGVKFTLIAAIIGIPLGLPGAAVSLGLDPAENEDDMGAIKMAGPLSNLIFGFLCMIVGFILPVSSLPLIKQWVLQAAVYNFTLGLFNMIPKEFGSFALDGKFIYTWKRPYFIALLLFLVVCYAITLGVSIPNGFI